MARQNDAPGPFASMQTNASEKARWTETSLATPISFGEHSTAQKGGGFQLRLKAGSVRHLADSGHVEVVVRFWWFLVFDVLDPYMVPAIPDSMAAPRVRLHPTILPWKRCNPSRLKAWGFLIPYWGL